jgi:hypothetical protein
MVETPLSPTSISNEPLTTNLTVSVGKGISTDFEDGVDEVEDSEEEGDLTVKRLKLIT